MLLFQEDIRHSRTLLEGINGMKFTARYGYVGLAVEQKEFIAEGVNEAGLSAGLFYFPSYGKYEDYNASEKENTISDASTCFVDIR